jgi:uncharacterized membrane protein YfcA
VTLLAALATVAIGILAGVLSVLAGGGVTVVLPVLLALGLSADQANSTSRFNLMIGAIIATSLLVRKKKVDWRSTLPLLVATAIGTVIGTSLGLTIRSTAMLTIIVATSVVSMVLVFVRQNQWLSKGPTHQLVSQRMGAVIGAQQPIDRWRGRGGQRHPAPGRAGAADGHAGKVDWSVAAWLAGGTAIGAAVASGFTASEEARHWVYRLLQVSVTVETLLLVAQTLGWLPHM